MILGRWDEAQAVVDEAARRFPTRKDEATLIELVVAKGDVGEARRLLAAASERDIFLDKEDQAMVMVNPADLETWEGNLAAAREAADAALRQVLHSDRPIAATRAFRVALRPPPTHARPPGQTWAGHRVEAGGPSAGGYRRRRMVPSVGLTRSGRLGQRDPGDERPADGLRPRLCPIPPWRGHHGGDRRT